MTVSMLGLILKKRSGEAHTKTEIDFLVSGIMDGSIPDYQLSAWLMAVCWRGMTLQETAYLTDAMCRSGEVLDLSDIGPLFGDKHSTGGVGDKTTLVFVPLLKAAGIPMAKLSGRGLGHTGGTIDKMEAIPGMIVDLPIQKFKEQLADIGIAIGGQTGELAPCDGKIYAMRDVTGTVQSIPLIAASVMSKKLAAGANLIILDVKCGKGAFMETLEDARDLAETMAKVGRILERPVLAVVTDMEQPLGMAVGHTLEVIEAIETLKGKGPADLNQLCMELGAVALVEAKLASNVDEAKAKLSQLIASGEALESFRLLIQKQGGDPRVIDDYSIMPQAKIKQDLFLDEALINDMHLPQGKSRYWIKQLDGKRVAEACKLMGAGRTKKGQSINLAVGVVLAAKVGDHVDAGARLATIYGDSQNDVDQARAKLIEAFTLSPEQVDSPQLIKAVIT